MLVEDPCCFKMETTLDKLSSLPSEFRHLKHSIHTGLDGEIIIEFIEMGNFNRQLSSHSFAV